MAGDLLGLENQERPGERLIQPVMIDGRRLDQAESLADIRLRAKRELARLPERLRRLNLDSSYPVEIAGELVELASEVDRRLQGPQSSPQSSPHRI